MMSNPIINVTLYIRTDVPSRCLLSQSEIYEDSPVLTLDSDFLIYRQHRNQNISVIMPDP